MASSDGFGGTSFEQCCVCWGSPSAWVDKVSPTDKTIPGCPSCDGGYTRAGTNDELAPCPNFEICRAKCPGILFPIFHNR